MTAEERSAGRRGVEGSTSSTDVGVRAGQGRGGPALFDDLVIRPLS